MPESRTDRSASGPEAGIGRRRRLYREGGEGSCVRCWPDAGLVASGRVLEARAAAQGDATRKRTENACTSARQSGRSQLDLASQ
eukprot:6186278-Pleurochrysis_carterae.AAC.3